MAHPAATASVCLDEPSRLFVPRRGHEEPRGAPSAGGARKAEGLLSARLRASSGRLPGPSKLAPMLTGGILQSAGLSSPKPADVTGRATRHLVGTVASGLRRRALRDAAPNRVLALTVASAPGPAGVLEVGIAGVFCRFLPARNTGEPTRALP